VRSRIDGDHPAAPPLTGRVHYLIGGTLSPEHREWVRADLTGPGWRHRQAARPLLLMLPFAIIFAGLPAPSSLRVSVPLILLLCAIAMGYATSENFRNRRLDQHGLPRPKPADEVGRQGTEDGEEEDF
jgi:hypothetical protein